VAPELLIRSGQAAGLGCSGRRAPRRPDHPRQPRLLDRGGGGCGRARDQFAALLPIRERVLGAEHPDTLTARSNLAHWTTRVRS